MDWQEEMTTKYPELFDGRFHFEIPEGWRVLVESAIRQLHCPVVRARKAVEVAKEYLGTTPTWTPEYLALAERDLEKTLKALPKILQVKEKFGALRIYTTTTISPRASGVIEMAEDLSTKTCQVCGKTGEDVSLVGPGWFQTLCPTHRDERHREG